MKICLLVNKRFFIAIMAIFLLLITLLDRIAFGAPPLPGSVYPGLVPKNYLPGRKPSSLSSPAPKAIVAQEKVNSPGGGAEAEKIKFKLTKIIFEGNHTYSENQLSPLYKKKINTLLSIAELQNIVQDVTNFYRNNGYILSRAIIPPQHVQNGVIRIRVIEGYIDKVKVVGNARGAQAILLAYGEKISQVHPLQAKVMDKYLRLANEIPGVQVKAILEPSKTQLGASDLNLAVQEQMANASLSYDNYGTLYIGPLQVTANASINSIFRSGDSTRATYLMATHGKQLHYFDLAYETPLGGNGLTFTFDGNQSLTAPGLNLQSLQTQGKANTYSATLQYPVIRARSEDLTLDGNFTYMDSSTTIFNRMILLYIDHIRSVNVGGTYDFADRFNGTNSSALHLEKGLNILGASNDPTSLITSRFGADSIYTKIYGQIGRVQPFLNRFSLYVLASGQYSFNPLLSSEQFGFGGSQVGRGYDPAEILGDRGVGGTIELRMDTYPQKLMVQSMQFYTYYDAGVVWNIKNVANTEQKQSAASTGVGVRFALSKLLTGNLMYTQVLTRSIASETLIGRGRTPRIFFSLAAAV
jgi:hemolysin activation/secretion protein